MSHIMVHISKKYTFNGKYSKFLSKNKVKLMKMQ